VPLVSAGHRKRVALQSKRGNFSDVMDCSVDLSREKKKGEDSWQRLGNNSQWTNTHERVKTTKNKKKMFVVAIIPTG